MEFILAEPKDFDIIFKMMNSSREAYTKIGIFQWNENYPTAEMINHDILDKFSYLIIDNDKVYGFFTTNSICEDDVHNKIKWHYNGNKWIILHRLCIALEHQGNGIGTRVLTKYENIAKVQGYESIRIDVFGTNSIAIHIYEKFGYTRVGEAVCDRGKFYIYDKVL